MPCNYKNYPVNWKSEIRPAILERDGNCCKFCGAKNGDFGWRSAEGNFYNAKYIIDALEDYGDDLFNNVLKNCYDKKGNPTKGITIVLTIMHLDHDTANNNYDNLAAGCQKCHLNFDLKNHMKNSRETRNKKKGLQSLF
jgi:hypothetical protein